jgi:hypothetical protein
LEKLFEENKVGTTSLRDFVEGLELLKDFFGSICVHDNAEMRFKVVFWHNVQL